MTLCLITGATDERMLVAAEEKWIRQRFSSAVIGHRELAFDPLATFTFASVPTTVTNASLEHFWERVEFVRGGKTNVGYFAYDPSRLRPPTEDLSLLYRCIELIQKGEIHRGM